MTDVYVIRTPVPLRIISTALNAEILFITQRQDVCGP
jgi:hypothetical protein